MKNNLILIAILATIGLSSCANWMPFTTAIEEQYDLTADERSQLQLKNNKKIVLQNQNDTLEKEIKNGELVVLKDSKESEVIIPEKTFGVMTEPSNSGSLTKVSFSKDEECFLRFLPDPNNGGKYVLALTYPKNGTPFLKYCSEDDNESKFTVSEGKGAYLLFSKKQNKKMEKKSKKEKGRKI